MTRVALLVAVSIVLAVNAWASIHVVTYKRDPRGAAAWLWAIWMTPIVGAFLYFMLGINHIGRRATRMRGRRHPLGFAPCAGALTAEALGRLMPSHLAHFAALARVGDAITGRTLLPGNNVEPLIDGDEAYPAMLKAIEGAKRSVSLLAYIFVVDEVGEQFIDALARARARGVAVRVLLDDIGSSRTLAEAQDAFDAADVRMARFFPLRVLKFARHAGLRNHRKILVADGLLGFTGGMNIRSSHLVRRPQPRHEQDVHFRLSGPVVQHLQEVFTEDWAFATGEILGGEDWFPQGSCAGATIARGVAFDPGERPDSLRTLIVAALSTARTSVRIVTPYFLPDAALVSALNVAALRGVRVEIVLPEISDVRLVQWAMSAMLWQVLGSGCRVFLTPPPFDHAKLMVVDEAWVLLGSANLDPRSLRLSFEMNVECFDPSLAAAVGRLVQHRIDRGRAVTLRELDQRSLPVRIRDGTARLLTPFL